MFTPCTQLPDEVWSHVFSLLSLPDRLSVRAACKHFRDLVDVDLCRDKTVELTRSSDAYDASFWDMLRRFRVTSLYLNSPQNWTRIAQELPGLRTLITFPWAFPDVKMQEALRVGFPNLESLHIQFRSRVSFKDLSLLIPQQLVLIRVCMEDWIGDKVFDLPPEIAPDSPFKNLRSLAFHCNFDSHPVNVLHFFLSSLPQLQHLSLSMFVSKNNSFEGHISDLPPLHNCALSSLELLRCETKTLPLDLMKMLSPLAFLRSLAIYSTIEDDRDIDNDESQKLSAWLRDLPALTSLLVGYMRLGFVSSIPSSVTRLMLRPDHVPDSEDMTALSAQLPNLRQLYLVPWDDPEVEPEDPCPCPIPEMALIPRLFPGLRTLSLSHNQVSEDTFLSLASLKELKVLEIVDKEPPPAALISKLQALTNNRVNIHRRAETYWTRACICSYSIPTDYWT